jgi:large subunit ribosomal protein L4
MLTVPVYNPTGQKIGEESIDPADFGGTVNKQLLHDVVLMHLSNRRVGTVNTRGRADVAGSGKKMYRQKGTGNARMGAKRTNKRKGGGSSFARRNRDYSYAIPKRAMRAAIRMAVLSKFQDHQVVVVDGMGPSGPDSKPKTKDVAKTLFSIPRPDLKDTDAAPAEQETKAAIRRRTLGGRSVLIGLPENDAALYRSARNIEGVCVAPIAEFNTYDVLRQRYLVLTRAALEALKQLGKQPAVRRPSED